MTQNAASRASMAQAATSQAVTRRDRAGRAPHPQRAPRRIARAAALLAALAAVSLQTAAEARSCLSPRTKVVGGEAASISDWPGFAAIREPGAQGGIDYVCGGAAIAPGWVLTAAHCLPSEPPEVSSARFEVVMGVEDLAEATPNDVFAVESWIVHPDYTDPIGKGRDIALLRLARPYLGPLMPLSLETDTDPVHDDIVRVAGFGATRFRSPNAPFLERLNDGRRSAGSQELLETTLAVVARPRCQDLNGMFDSEAIGPRQICAGPDEGPLRGSCQGDSGGPLVTYDAEDCPVQVGLVSWAVQCGRPDYPAVYTRISAYADWIAEIIGERPQTVASLQTVGLLSPGERAALQRQLRSMLGPAEGNLELRIGEGRTRFRVKDQVTIFVRSAVAGELYLIDVNAEGQVTPIFPNEFVQNADVRAVRPGEWIEIPNGPQYNFDYFEAVPPYGESLLIALVAPEGAPMTQSLTRGLAPRQGLASAPVAAAPLKGLLGDMERRIADGSDPARWGMALLPYEIIR